MGKLYGTGEGPPLDFFQPVLKTGRNVKENMNNRHVGR